MARKDRGLSRSVAAVSYDSRLLPPLERQGHWGKVQSCFPHAINLRLPEGDLAALVPLEKLNGPGFVCLEWGSLLRLVREDLLVLLVDSVHFLLPGGSSWSGPPARLIVDLGPARPWRPPPFPLPPPRAALKNPISVLAGNNRIPSDSLSRECVKRGAALISATRQRDGRQYEAAFLSLLGLGHGLTPAGDDFLTGALAAGWWLKGRKTDAFLREESAKLIARHAGKTTPVSRHFLSAAAQGVFCEFVYRLLDAFSGGDEKGIAAWADRIRGWGATSGAWFLHGFASAAQALAGIGLQKSRGLR